MVITHAGDNLSHLFGSERFVGEPIACKFGLRRPQMEFTWENVSMAVFRINLGS